MKYGCTKKLSIAMLVQCNTISFQFELNEQLSRPLSCVATRCSGAHTNLGQQKKQTLTEMIIWVAGVLRRTVVSD